MKLKPCPFCGSNDMRIVADTRWTYVHCDGCDVRGGPHEGPGADLSAAASWNNRPPADGEPGKIVQTACSEGESGWVTCAVTESGELWRSHGGKWKLVPGPTAGDR